MASTADRVASIITDRKNTRFALAASLVATTDELQALRTEISVLRAELERERALRTFDNASSDDVISALRTQLAAAAQTMQSGSEQEQADAAQLLYRAAAPRTERKLPAHFVAAREAAMRMGRAVKVTA